MSIIFNRFSSDHVFPHYQNLLQIMVCLFLSRSLGKKKIKNPFYGSSPDAFGFTPAGLLSTVIRKLVLPCSGPMMGWTLGQSCCRGSVLWNPMTPWTRSTTASSSLKASKPWYLHTQSVDLMFYCSVRSVVEVIYELGM